MLYKRTAAIALSMALLSPAAALAAGRGMEGHGNVQELQRVEVTGSRLAEEIADVPAPAYIVTREDIDRSGARNAQEVLNRIPGVVGLYGSSTMALDKGISVRGVTSEVLLLVDGIPFMGSNYGVGIALGSPFDLRTIPVDAIDRIEVVKGASSAIYGSNAAGGVINVITRKGAEKSSASLKAEVGSNGWFRGAFRGTAVMSDDLRVTLGYTRTQETDNVKLRLVNPATDSYDYARDYRGNDYVLNIQKGCWSFLGEAGDYHSQWDYTNSYSHVLEHDRQKNKYARASLNYADGTNTGRIYHSSNKRDVFNSAGETDYRDKAWGATFNRRQTLGKVPFLWGLDWRQEKAQYENKDNPWGNNKPYDLKRNGLAPYAEATLLLGEANLDLGLRYEYWDVDDGDNVKELIPRISLNWESPTGLLWYATAGRHFSMPSFYQMFYADSSGYSIPNPNLKSEQGWTYDVGVKGEKAENPWNLGLFYMDLKDKIKYQSDPITYIGQYMNVDKYRAWGIEGRITFNIDDHWSYTQGISWIKAEEKKGDGGSWTRSDDPRWDLAGFLNYVNGPWTGEVAMHYYADRRLTSATYDDNDIFMVNASLGWKRNEFTLKAAVNNIFDKEYVITNSGYLVPERRFILSCEYNF